MSGGENPAAFPQFGMAFGTDPMLTGGMTLRDWFAGQAPPMPDAFQHEGYPTDWIPGHEWTSERQAALNAKTNAWAVSRAVAWSCAYADAMLAAREQSK